MTYCNSDLPGKHQDLCMTHQSTNTDLLVLQLCTFGVSQLIYALGPRPRGQTPSLFDSHIWPMYLKHKNTHMHIHTYICRNILIVALRNNLILFDRFHYKIITIQKNSVVEFDAANKS